MKKLLSLIILSAALFGCAARNLPVGTYQVARVVDGDTIDVDSDGEHARIRILGINTPETVDPRKPVQCFGPEASHEAKQLLTGKTVTLKADPTQDDRDKYGRFLRYVTMEDGADFGKFMISEGYAYEYTFHTANQHQAQYRAAQKAAKLAKRGLWSPTTCRGKL